MKKIVKSRLLGVSGSKIMVLKKVGSPLRYTLPGGIKKRKETEKEALVRETREEIELQLTEGQARFYLSYVKRTDNERVIKNYFYATLEPMHTKVKERHKFETVLWLKWKKAIEFMDKSDRLAVKAYYRNLQIKDKNLHTYERKISSRITM